MTTALQSDISRPHTSSRTLITALLRVSTDEQDTTRQRMAIERYAADHGLKIDLWLEDKSSRDLSEIRPEFQRLLEMVKDGRVKVILIEKADRLGMKGKEEFFHYRYIFQQKRCKLLSVTDGDLTALDELTAIKLFFTADASKHEQRSISQRVLSGKQRWANEGVWLGGPAPLGYDKVCLDAKGDVIWRLIRDGKDEYSQVFQGGHTVKVRGSPGHGKQERLVLDVNERQAEIVKRIFRVWTTQRISLMGLAALLNRQGIRLHSKPFNGMTIRTILRNERYLGKAIYNEKPTGRFKELRNGQVVDIPDEKRIGLTRKFISRPRNDPSQWIVKEGAHAAIIDQRTFDQAQEKLAQVKDNKRHSPRNDVFWLSGLLHCSTCARKMKGCVYKGKPYYLCSTFDTADHRGLADQCPCGRNVVPATEVEKIVTDWLKEKQIRLNEIKKDRYKSELDKFDAVLREYVQENDDVFGKDWQGYIDQMEQDFGITDSQDRMYQLIAKLASAEVRAEISLDDVIELDGIKTKRAKERLQAVEQELTDAYRAKAKAKTEAEEIFWEKEQTRLEGESEKWRQWAIPYQERASQAIQYCNDLMERMAEYNCIVEESGNREKAEAIRQVISRIDLAFTKTENTAEKVRQCIEEMGIEAPSRKIAKRLAEMGLEVETRNIATIRQRLRKGRPTQNRYFYRVASFRIHSSPVATTE